METLSSAVPARVDDVDEPVSSGPRTPPSLCAGLGEVRGALHANRAHVGVWGHLRLGIRDACISSAEFKKQNFMGVVNYLTNQMFVFLIIAVKLRMDLVA